MPCAAAVLPTSQHRQRADLLDSLTHDWKTKGRRSRPLAIRDRISTYLALLLGITTGQWFVLPSPPGIKMTPLSPTSMWSLAEDTS